MHDRSAYQPDPQQLIERFSMHPDTSLPHYFGPPVANADMISAVLDQAGVSRALYRVNVNTRDHAAIHYTGTAQTPESTRFYENIARMLQTSGQFESASTFRPARAFAGPNAPRYPTAVSVTFIKPDLPGTILRSLLPRYNQPYEYYVKSNDHRFVSYIRIVGNPQVQARAHADFLNILRSRPDKILRADSYQDPGVGWYIFVIHQLPPWPNEYLRGM